VIFLYFNLWPKTLKDSQRHPKTNGLFLMHLKRG
jgi:hypothetical protein